MSQATTSKPKKTVDEEISAAVSVLTTKIGKKFTEAGKSDIEKAFARILNAQLKSKQENKGAKSQEKINSEMGTFMGKTPRYKEDYYTMIASLVRASLDAQPKPKQPKSSS